MDSGSKGELTRFFTIEASSATYKDGENKGKRIAMTGRYSGGGKLGKHTPKAAANKVARALFKMSSSNTVTFILRETTRGIGSPYHVYTAKHEKLPKPLVYKRVIQVSGTKVEKEFTVTHKNVVTKITNDNEIAKVFRDLKVTMPEPSIRKTKMISRKSSSMRGGSKMTHDVSDISNRVRSMMQSGGSTQCCQAAPADFSHPSHAISSPDQIQLAQQSHLNSSSQQALEAQRQAYLDSVPATVK